MTHALVVKVLEFKCKLHEKFVAPKEIGIGNRVMLEEPNTSNQFTEVKPVFARQNVLEERRTKTIEILLKLPSFITCI